MSQKNDNNGLINDNFFSSSSQNFKYNANAISNRLPNAVFTGPRGLYNHRQRLFDYPHEIGIGQSSQLRSLDINYLTRGKSGILLKQRRDFPNEIGWSHNFFKDIFPYSVSRRSVNSALQVPR